MILIPSLRSFNQQFITSVEVSNPGVPHNRLSARPKQFHLEIRIYVLCLCARLFICALWSPAGKGLTSWLSFVVSTVSLSLSHWYPGSGVVLDCIDS